MLSTADLCDVRGSATVSCDLPLLQFGGRSVFRGPAVTIRCHEDNHIVKMVVSEPGQGRVLVVDGSGSLRCALMGDNMARLAAQNGWSGVVINGAVRDVALLRTVDLGVKAGGANPRRSGKAGTGFRDVAVGFGGVVFVPGCVVTSDDDGITVQNHV
ncbi:ribonuclease E activity regulator RraA [Rhodococcoides yunnanense]|uniref:4-hydroxy-4-methyl-2-oxoglutarate aldolase n=1 Tax=Rhodococcoides yunnanense TaxID=278209 RepID=A0ABU4BIF7_9NOCA|nr:ribonuclease E activity regulator RraA [Rhodococcus yunnanensis]MDV6263995.1 ribonuclease E activity regulator RraA [Rhodococcus yunnanensis]